MDDILKGKLQKLHRIATCSTGNPNEVANAAAALQRLLTLNNLEMTDIAIQAEEAVPVSDQTYILKGRMESWKLILMATIAKVNSTVALKSRHNFILCGRPSDIAAARYMFEAVSLSIDACHKVWKSNREVTLKSDSRNFRYGCAGTVSERLRQLHQQLTAPPPGENKTTAMVLIDTKLTQAVSYAGMISGKSTQIRPPSKPSAYLDGRAAGRTINLPGSAPTPQLKGTR